MGLGGRTMKSCFCEACGSCKETPNNCEIKKLKALLRYLILGNEKPLRLVDYANKTREELNNSLKVWNERG